MGEAVRGARRGGQRPRWPEGRTLSEFRERRALFRGRHAGARIAGMYPGRGDPFLPFSERRGSLSGASLRRGTPEFRTTAARHGGIRKGMARRWAGRRGSGAFSRRRAAELPGKPWGRHGHRCGAAFPAGISRKRASVLRGSAQKKGARPSACNAVFFSLPERGLAGRPSCLCREITF